MCRTQLIPLLGKEIRPWWVTFSPGIGCAKCFRDSGILWGSGERSYKVRTCVMSQSMYCFSDHSVYRLWHLFVCPLISHCNHSLWCPVLFPCCITLNSKITICFIPFWIFKCLPLIYLVNYTPSRPLMITFFFSVCLCSLYLFLLKHL